MYTNESHDSAAAQRSKRRGGTVRRRATSAVVAAACLLPASPAAAAVGDLTLESESGVGHGRVMPRSNASNRASVLLHRHESRHHRLEVATAATYEVRARWSNDSHLGPLEHVSVLLDGKLVGSLVALDSGALGWGFDWDSFLTSSEPVGTVRTSAGRRHTLSAAVTQADQWGMELDCLLLRRVA